MNFLVSACVNGGYCFMSWNRFVLPDFDGMFLQHSLQCRLQY